jgi:glycolate dehydrogenase iron-sulfur subunit
MKTEFSAQQLADPTLGEIEKILRKCVHCGFCNATCPTFQLKGDELDGPRGRIYLIKDMLESESTPTREVVKHVDRCLSCLSCTTTCPSGVDYMHLIDHGRTYIEQHHKRSFADTLLRQLLSYLLPSPFRFRCSLLMSKLARPLASFLPAPLRAAVRLSWQGKPDTDNEVLKASYLADGKSRGRVGLLPGCAQQVVANEINSASIRLLNRFGFDVHVLNDTDCCAAIEQHLGKTDRANNRVKKNLQGWASILPDLDALIINASGCGTMIKDYAHLMKDNNALADLAKEVSNKTRDICEFFAQHKLDINHIKFADTYMIAYQNPCSMQHGQKISQQPVQLLRAFGFNTTVIPEAHLCCGSAGTYNILQADMAEQLGKRKADNIHSTQAHIIASGNLGCILQLRQYCELPIVHTVQLLDWASGGPKPAETE